MMLGGDTFIDKIMQPIVDGISAVLKVMISMVMYNGFTMGIFWLTAINLIAVKVMKNDKQYAKEEKRRIKESTLLFIAFMGGAIGMYYAMYKYKHKTLHKKFTICVPFFIMLHFFCISFLIMNSFIV